MSSYPYPRAQLRPATAAPPVDAGSSGLLAVIDEIRDSKLLIGACMLLALAAAAAYIALVPPIYEGSALIQVEEGKAANGTGSAYADAANLFDVRAPAIAEMSILRSGLVLGEVVDSLHLDVEAAPQGLPQKDSLPAAIAYLRGEQKIKVGAFAVPAGEQGKHFGITLAGAGYELTDPAGRLLLTGATGVDERFRTQDGEGTIRVDSAAGAAGTKFEVRRVARNTAIEKLQRALKIEEQGKQSGMLRMRLAGPDPDLVAQTLNGIGQAFLRQNVERKTAEAQKALAFVESVLPKLHADIVEAESKLTRFRNQHGTFDLGVEGRLALEQSVRLQTTLVELQNKQRDMGMNWGAEHPGMRALASQIANVTAALGSVNRRVRVLPEVEQDMLGLTRELKVNSELYASLLNSAQQLRLAKESRVANVRQVDYASPSLEPAGPQPAALLAAGATGGLVAGMLIALLRRSLRRGVQDPDWIESQSNLNVWAAVPHSNAQQRLSNSRGKLGYARVLAVRSPQDPAIESLRGIRAVLQAKMPSAGSNIVLVTGPTHGIGKSFTSTNLATVLAAVGHKVLLVDADMRKGRLADALGVAASPGLSDILAGSASVSEGLRRSVVANLDFIPAGSGASSPADLLTGPAAHLLFGTTLAAYDLVIVDTSPILAAADAAILAQWAGAVFMVVRADVTSLRELHEAEKRLTQQGTGVDGVIYTGVDISKRRNEIYSYGAYTTH
jgi:tyrosine-protein kinase Etk/Wzc